VVLPELDITRGDISRIRAGQLAEADPGPLIDMINAPTCFWFWRVDKKGCRQHWLQDAFPFYSRRFPLLFSLSLRRSWRLFSANAQVLSFAVYAVLRVYNRVFL